MGITCDVEIGDEVTYDPFYCYGLGVSRVKYIVFDRVLNVHKYLLESGFSIFYRQIVSVRK